MVHALLTKLPFKSFHIYDCVYTLSQDFLWDKKFLRVLRSAVMYSFLKKARREVELQFSYLFPRCFKKWVIYKRTYSMSSLKKENSYPKYQCIWKLSGRTVSVLQHHLLPEHRRDLLKRTTILWFYNFCSKHLIKWWIWEEFLRNHSLKEKEAI